MQYILSSYSMTTGDGKIIHFTVLDKLFIGTSIDAVIKNK